MSEWGLKYIPSATFSSDGSVLPVNGNYFGTGSSYGVSLPAFYNPTATYSDIQQYGLLGNFTPNISWGLNQANIPDTTLSKESVSETNNTTPWYLNKDGTWNLQGIGQGLEGLAQLGSTVGNLLMSNKSYNLMKDQFKFQKNMTMNNYNNSLKQYNTRLADVANNRTQFSGNDHSQWYEDNKL